MADGVIGLSERLDSMRSEMKQEFEHLRSLISFSFADVNRRVTALEAWRERTERDPVEVVRGKLGRPKH